MTQRLAIAILNNSQHVQKTFAPGQIRLGAGPLTQAERVESDGQDTASHFQIDDSQLAPVQCSVQWQVIDDQPQVTLINHGRSIVLSSGPRVHRGQTVQLNLPVVLGLADTQVQIYFEQAKHALDTALTGLPSHRNHSTATRSIEGLSPGAGTLASWLEALGDLQRSVAGSHQFFDQAARAVFNPGGLDGGIVLLPTAAGWSVAASHLPYPDYGVGYREDLIERAVLAKETVFHDASSIDQENPVDDLHSAVVSPVLDDQGEPLAVVYGFRSQHRTNSRRGVRILEAQFVQVIADSISAGMTRMESEAEASRSRALIDQAFSPAVARHLENDPRFLEGKTREVTVLFADLRGFSSISESVGPKVTYELLTDVMDDFSKAVADHDGVVIDFFGDGLSAFWNAPLDQPDHAMLACQCAIVMSECMADLNASWERRLPKRLRVGVGIHTGTAMVGNSGSRTRLKYGPQGNTVNVASRIEGMSKHVGAPIVLSGETASRVGDYFLTRRVCRAQLDGIRQPTDLHQLLPLASHRFHAEAFEIYSRALSAFEEQDYSNAISLLSELESKNETDAVSQFLLTQAVSHQSGSSAAMTKFGIDSEEFSEIALAKSSQRRSRAT